MVILCGSLHVKLIAWDKLCMDGGGNNFFGFGGSNL